MKNLLKADLQKMCDEKGISYTSKTTKDELIKLIEKKKIPAKKDEGFKGEH